MRTRTKVVSIAAILSAAALGGGIAQAGAAQNTGAKPAEETVQTVDTDNVQEGDQTSPDVPAAHPASARAVSTGAAAPAASLAKTAAHVTVSGSHAAAASETAGENAGESAGENEQESEAANDGPGGHQDPPGDVQHEGGNNEQ